MTLRFTDDVGYVPPQSIRKADAAYLAAGKWRCDKTQGGAHHVVYDAVGVGVCKHCGMLR